MEINRALSIRPPAAFGLIDAPSPMIALQAIKGEGAAEPGKDVGRERVGELVGNIFYGTLLRQMNQSSLRGELFHGGRGEEAFQGQLVQHLAERIGRSENEPLSNAIYKSIQRRHGGRINGGAA